MSKSRKLLSKFMVYGVGVQLVILTVPLWMPFFIIYVVIDEIFKRFTIIEVATVIVVLYVTSLILK